MRFLFIFLFAIVSLTLRAQISFSNLQASEFKVLVEKKKGIILDTRSKGEFARGHIQGAVLIDLQDPNVQAILLALPKNKPLYCYCYSGARSRTVASFLVQNGYASVFNLQRGIVDWNANMFPLVTDNSAAKQLQPDALTPQQFQSVLASSKLVFVDFYAPWCAPCKQMMPMVEELMKEYDGRVKVVKVNSEASKELSQELGIPAVPYLVLYKDGKPVFSRDGLTEKKVLAKAFEDFL